MRRCSDSRPRADAAPARHTVQADGSLRARPLTTQQIEPDGTLWFFVPAGGDVAGAVAAKAHVSLTYADHGDSVYASVRGSAYLVHDPLKAEELWRIGRFVSIAKAALTRTAPAEGEHRTVRF